MRRVDPGDAHTSEDQGCKMSESTKTAFSKSPHHQKVLNCAILFRNTKNYPNMTFLGHFLKDCWLNSKVHCYWHFLLLIYTSLEFYTDIFMLSSTFCNSDQDPLVRDPCRQWRPVRKWWDLCATERTLPAGCGDRSFGRNQNPANGKPSIMRRFWEANCCLKQPLQETVGRILKSVPSFYRRLQGAARPKR